MTIFTTDDLFKKLKDANLNLYNIVTPDSFDGFVFSNMSQFLNFLNDNNIKNVFIEEIFSELDDYSITKDMLEEEVDLNSNLGKQILNEVDLYNSALKLVDFSIPSQIIFCVFYESHCFYYEHNNGFIIGGEPLLEPEDKLETILDNFKQELDIERNKHDELIADQITQLKAFIANDPSFKLCKNKGLRKDYIINLFNNVLGDEFNELKDHWYHPNINFLYKGAISLVELLWNELKTNK